MFTVETLILTYVFLMFVCFRNAHEKNVHKFDYKRTMKDMKDQSGEIGEEEEDSQLHDETEETETHEIAVE